MLGRDAIESLLPHGGDMLLLDSVASWTEREIICLTNTHRYANNPLRRGACLPVFCGVEYGAQAMAIHGSLIGGNQVRAGILGGLRDLVCHVERLDDIDGALTVQASLLFGEQRSFLYAFAVRGAVGALVEGQASVFLT